jgi:hypothetical protein
VQCLLSDVGNYFAILGQTTRRGWTTFFFTPADPTVLGCLRVATGLLAFWSLLVYGFDLHDYFGSHGWADAELVRSIQRPLAWSFWYAVGDDWLSPVWYACLAVLALYAIGLFSRVTAVLSWVIVVSTARRAPIALYGFDQVLSALAFYLAVTGASGQAVSLDRFWRRWRQAPRAAAAPSSRLQPGAGALSGRSVEWAQPPSTISANLAIRLIQLHLLVIYGMAGLSKLQGPSWWNGTAIWQMMATGEFVGWNFTALAGWPWIINLLTHLSLALELLYPVLVWVQIVRPLLLAGIVALHVGIAVINPGLTEFAVIMIAANLVFVSGAWFHRRFFPGVAWTWQCVYNLIAATRPRDFACTDDACGIHSRPTLSLARDRSQAQNQQTAIATVLDTEETPSP